MAIDMTMRSGSVGDMSWKQISLVGVSTQDYFLLLRNSNEQLQLTIQNSLHILVLRYSRIMPLVDGHRYFASTAVFLNELVKLTVSLTMALYSIATDPKTPDTSTATALFAELVRAMFAGDSWKLAIPAMLFTLQSSLHYVALSNLDAATFQVTDQLKILTTAVFSVLLLGKKLNARRWLSLLLLMAGVAIVQLPTGASHAEVLSMKDLKAGGASHAARSIWDLEEAGSGSARQLSKRSATYEGIEEDFAAANPQMNTSIGLIAVLMACITSGLAGVYFEKVLKESRGERAASVWIRNVQLSFYSLWPALFIGVVFWDGEHISKTGFFAGYNWVVWTNILLQAAGGILVSFVINYANNITKNFATSVSIVISFMGSVIFFDLDITLSVSKLGRLDMFRLTRCSTYSAQSSCCSPSTCTTKAQTSLDLFLRRYGYLSQKNKAMDLTLTWSQWLRRRDHLCARKAIHLAVPAHPTLSDGLQRVRI
jgi:UDP-galactose transporter